MPQPLLEFVLVTVTLADAARAGAATSLLRVWAYDHCHTASAFTDTDRLSIEAALHFVHHKTATDARRLLAAALGEGCDVSVVRADAEMWPMVAGRHTILRSSTAGSHGFALRPPPAETALRLQTLAEAIETTARGREYDFLVSLRSNVLFSPLEMSEVRVPVPFEVSRSERTASCVTCITHTLRGVLAFSASDPTRLVADGPVLSLTFLDGSGEPTPVAVRVGTTLPLLAPTGRVDSAVWLPHLASTHCVAEEHWCPSSRFLVANGAPLQCVSLSRIDAVHVTPCDPARPPVAVRVDSINAFQVHDPPAGAVGKACDFAVVLW